MRNIKIIAPSKDFPAAGKRHALRGRLSSSWKTPRAPRETFQPLENAMRSTRNFRNLRNGHALRGKLSQPAKRPRAPREAFATCETTTRSSGSFRNLRNGHALRRKLSQLAKKHPRQRAFFRNSRKKGSYGPATPPGSLPTPPDTHQCRLLDHEKPARGRGAL